LQIDSLTQAQSAIAVALTSSTNILNFNLKS
jgi:hypothetical protein